MTGCRHCWCVERHLVSPLGRGVLLLEALSLLKLLLGGPTISVFAVLQIVEFLVVPLENPG